MALRILVADDSPTIQKVIKIALARYLVDIVSVKSLAEAITEVTKTSPGAVLIDASLPGVKGPEDFLSLRRQASECPFIILVGSYENFDDSSFIQAGLREIIRKPFESNTITKTLSRVVGKGFDGAALATTIPGLTTPSVQVPAPVSPPPAGPPQTRVPPPPSGPNRLSEGGIATKPPLPNVTTQPAKVAPLDEPDGDQFTSVRPLPPPPPPGVGTSEPRGSRSSSGDGGHVPPPPLTDEKRRGQRAFSQGSISEGTDTEARVAPTIAPFNSGAPIPPSQVPTPRRAMGEDTVTPQINKEKIEDLVRSAVMEYCQKNFSSIAREVLTAEIRRIAEERSRHLADN